jgi:hypothetical protein
MQLSDLGQGIPKTGGCPDNEGMLPFAPRKSHTFAERKATMARIVDALSRCGRRSVSAFGCLGDSGQGVRRISQRQLVEQALHTVNDPRGRRDRPGRAECRDGLGRTMSSLEHRQAGQGQPLGIQSAVILTSAI